MRSSVPSAPLPIDPLLPEIVAALHVTNRVVLRAAPGAGKTTRVPAALLDAGLDAGRQVLVLEPRRIAARAAAAFVAEMRGGALGGEVGYRIRFEQRGGIGTRLWFLTEGVFGRQLAKDPFLEKAGVVVLDEFHERHVPGDLALAVVRELQNTVRPDLKLVIMSATLETEALAAFCGGPPGCRVFTCAGRAFPVAVEHVPTPDARRLATRVAGALRDVLADKSDRGDILVFLPGAAEIRRAASAIAPLAAAHDLLVMPLHGELPLDDQQRALQRAARRKVVLATNVAETSLTIDGVTAVIDSGLARMVRYDPRHGVNALRVAPISRAAAEQRAGRAGRTTPGRCVRLWTAADHAARLEREVPEIHRIDLSGPLLELRAWGLRDPKTLAWLDPPRAAVLGRGERLLALLGAVDPATGSLTDLGRRMLALPVPPRLARLLIEAERRGRGEEGALLAALASERDICLETRAFGSVPRNETPTASSDLLRRAELFAAAQRTGFDAVYCQREGLDRGTLAAVARGSRQLRRHSAARTEHKPGHSIGTEHDDLLRCILAAFPDRVVRRRAPGSPRGVMTGGAGVVLDSRSVVRNAELFVAVDIEGPAAAESGGRGELRVRLASAVERSWLDELFPGAVSCEETLEFDAAGERVVRRRRECFRGLVLAEHTSGDVDRTAAGEVLARSARRDPWRAADVGATARAFLARLRFLARTMPEIGLPEDADAFLADTVAAICAGKRSFAELRRSDLLGPLAASLGHHRLHVLDREAPARLALPGGRSAPVDYERNGPPAVAARIQEVFGLRSTPCLAGGRVRLVFELLAPSLRPVQVTDDLESFWRTAYPEVRKTLRGRYPKHRWPEDPLAAPPGTRVSRPPP